MKVILEPQTEPVDVASISALHQLTDRYPLAKVQTTDGRWVPVEQRYPVWDGTGV